MSLAPAMESPVPIFPEMPALCLQTYTASGVRGRTVLDDKFAILLILFGFRTVLDASGQNLAPQVGLEPTTLRLTAECSAIELLRSV